MTTLFKTTMIVHDALCLGGVNYALGHSTQLRKQTDEINVSSSGVTIPENCSPVTGVDLSKILGDKGW